MNSNFMKSQTKQILKILAVYIMWNLKIGQDAPNRRQFDPVLLLYFDYKEFIL